MKEQGKNFIFTILLSLIFSFSVLTAQAQQTTRTITVSTEPNAVVWINDIRFGATDENGKLIVKTGTGAKKLRVRAEGFKEASQNLLPAQKGEVKVTLTKATDEAEITFQQAEAASVVDREKAVELYKKALAQRPKYMDAQVGLARVLIAANKTEEALTVVREAKKWRPGYSELSAIEGRIHTLVGDEDAAVAAFKRAIVEGRGFQPEAHTGLGMLYRDKAEASGGEGDYDAEKENYLLAAAELKKAVAQLSGAPDAIVVYQLLGDTYERTKMFKEAIAVYEEFLQIFPDTSEATAVESFIVQIKKQMDGEQ